MQINDILTFYDKVLIIVLLLISIVLLIIPLYFYQSNSQNLVLKVQQGREIIKTISAKASYKKDISFEVKGPIGTHLIEFSQGRARVKKAPAADPLKICQKSGWIDSVGPIIVCVPNTLSIWLESSESDLDGMSW